MKSLMLMVLLAIAGIAQGESRPATLDELVERIRKEAASDKIHDAEREKRFLMERNQQKSRLKKLKDRLSVLQRRADELRAAYEKNETRIRELDGSWREQAGVINDLFAIVHQNAAEVNSLLTGSMISAQLPGRSELTEKIIKRRNQASMEDIKALWLALLDEMNQSAKVERFETPVITAEGEEKADTVTRVGVFNASSGGKFLRYLPASEKFVELAKQPPARFRKLAATLEESQSGLVPMAIDPSKGAILALMVESPDLKDRIQQGGAIGYIILLIGFAGLGIVVVRYFALGLGMRRIRDQMDSPEAADNNPLGRLILCADQHRTSDREALALQLDETVHRETKRLHLGLTTLTVFATVSPLLGLLGTVTGMIDTFEAISLFGTGDPKLMSGGISQALVTTQLGLAVAIPLLLLHSFLHGRANRLVEVLDEKSVELFDRIDDPVLAENG